jgi:hypothetical protein
MQSSGNNIFIGFFSLLLVIVLALMGCGGGSAGTGTGPVVIVQGAVYDESGQPVEDVRIRAVDTGGEDTTSSDGEFQLVTEPDSGTVTLEVSSETGVALVNIDIPQDGGTVSVTITVNPRLTEINADSLEVGSAIVGRCDLYFENSLVIRQANRVPKDLTCVAKVFVRSNRRRLSQVPIAIQYRDCEQLQPWTTVAVGSTMAKPNAGIGQVQFPYIDDETHCLYRIVAPFGVPNLPEFERIIETSTFQRRQ